MPSGSAIMAGDTMLARRRVVISNTIASGLECCDDLGLNDVMLMVFMNLAQKDDVGIFHAAKVVVRNRSSREKRGGQDAKAKMEEESS